MNNQDFSPSNEQKILQMSGTGYVIVSVSTARGAIPLTGALVHIFTYESGGKNGSLLVTTRTDASGKTARIPLPCPPRSSSRSPGNGRSYATYNIDAQYDGYYNQYYVNVPIFDGVTAIQNVDLVPVAENGRNGQTLESRFYETENPTLE